MNDPYDPALAPDQSPNYPLVRDETTCRGCGRAKEIGLIVCWGCFKYRADNPYKYFRAGTHLAGRLDLWLAELKESAR